MQIKFLKLHIHHFLSFDDAIIDLNDKGFCLISGINKNPKDAAKSNGSGKSTIANAVAFALIGETISGLKSNLSNIYFNDGCYVELDFSVDSNHYKLIRSRDDKSYGTNLKILVNGEDKSGKGIRESQAVLDELLPDLTRELIGSVILLGQGLPDKFTSNSPSDRKEVLEHLSKSDFMIQDLKERVDRRIVELNNKIRSIEDKLLVNKSKTSLYKQQLDKLNLDLEEAFDNGFDKMDFNIQIRYLEEQLEDNSTNKKELEELIEEQTKEYDLVTNEYQAQLNKTNEKLEKLRIERDSFSRDFNKKRSDLIIQKTTLINEIQKLESIIDVCPTCGQKIPGAIKPDTTNKRKDLESIENEIKDLDIKIKENEDEYNNKIESIKNQYNSDTESSLKSINDLKSLMNEERNSLSIINEDIMKLNSSLTKLQNAKENYESNIRRIQNEIKNIENSLSNLEIEFKEENFNLEDTNTHLDVVVKMNTYLKRDFRGILLQNSIDYINKKSKEYSSKIFNTDEIEFKLDGNNIDIMFCNKDYENLSGGEKQRVDLITQFAIRSMMSNYLKFSSNILFLDEITDNLDKDSCDRVINFLTQELKDIESIFIISHHSDLNIPYDSEIVVQKNVLGISEVL